MKTFSPFIAINLGYTGCGILLFYFAFTYLKAWKNNYDAITASNLADWQSDIRNLS